MLGLIKQDMSQQQNEWAWYGYQVSMRVLEVSICTLLAVIATTPLRSEFAEFVAYNHQVASRSHPSQFHLHPQHHLTAQNGTMMIAGIYFCQF